MNLFLLLALLALAACTETRIRGYGQRPFPPEPRPAAPAPPDARTNALVLTVGVAPLDTNGNGYPDLISASAHLFDRRYAQPLREDGAFSFELYAPGEVGLAGAEPIRSWRIEGEALQRAFGRSRYGVSYHFRLSLLEGGGDDRLPIAMGDLAGRFEPADGRAPVYAGEVSTIQLGRRVRVPETRWPPPAPDPDPSSPSDPAEPD